MRLNLTDHLFYAFIALLFLASMIHFGSFIFVPLFIMYYYIFLNTLHNEDGKLISYQDYIMHGHKIDWDRTNS